MKIAAISDLHLDINRDYPHLSLFFMSRETMTSGLPSLTGSASITSIRFSKMMRDALQGRRGGMEMSLSSGMSDGMIILSAIIAASQMRCLRR